MTRNDHALSIRPSLKDPSPITDNLASGFLSTSLSLTDCLTRTASSPHSCKLTTSTTEAYIHHLRPKPTSTPSTPYFLTSEASSTLAPSAPFFLTGEASFALDPSTPFFLIDKAYSTLPPSAPFFLIGKASSTLTPSATPSTSSEAFFLTSEAFPH